MTVLLPAGPTVILPAGGNIPAPFGNVTGWPGILPPEAGNVTVNVLLPAGPTVIFPAGGNIPAPFGNVTGWRGYYRPLLGTSPGRRGYSRPLAGAFPAGAGILPARWVDIPPPCSCSFYLSTLRQVQRVRRHSVGLASAPARKQTSRRHRSITDQDPDQGKFAAPISIQSDSSHRRSDGRRRRSSVTDGPWGGLRSACRRQRHSNCAYAHCSTQGICTHGKHSRHQVCTAAHARRSHPAPGGHARPPRAKE